jgi:hypothetical protein
VASVTSSGIAERLGNLAWQNQSSFAQEVTVFLTLSGHLLARKTARTTSSTSAQRLVTYASSKFSKNTPAIDGGEFTPRRVYYRDF